MAKCISKSTGKELSAYETKKEAEESAAYSKKNFKLNLYAYKCDECGKFHLAPKDSKIDVKHNACSCTDSNGKPKALYGSKKDAEKQQKKSEEEQKVKLYIFKCPETGGYHLTHHAPEEYKDIPKEKKSSSTKSAPAKKPSTKSEKKSIFSKLAEKIRGTSKKK